VEWAGQDETRFRGWYVLRTGCMRCNCVLCKVRYGNYGRFTWFFSLWLLEKCTPVGQEPHLMLLLLSSVPLGDQKLTKPAH
jgi:hypothetical protein